MPRPTRSQGRPGTPVIPKDWETSHAIVATKTMTGTCRIRPQATSNVEPVMNADLSYDTSTADAAIYTGPCRIQELKTRDTGATVGEQDLRIANYLVTIGRDAGDIPVGALVEVISSTDATLASPRRLVVRTVARGTLRWERDLHCVDDMSRESA
jgi:hypothetical protein